MRSHPQASRSEHRGQGQECGVAGAPVAGAEDGGDGSDIGEGEHWAFQPALQVPCSLV